MKILDSSNIKEIHVDMEDFVFTQEDLREIDLLESNIFQQEESTMCSDTRHHNSDHILSDSDLESEKLHIPKKRRRLIIPSDSESEADSVVNYVLSNITTKDHTSTKWSRPRRQQPSVIPFTDESGMNKELANSLKTAYPGNFYSLLIPDEAFELIAEQTNLFAIQSIPSVRKPSSRSHAWKPTDKYEIKRFFGLILYMGLVRLPKLSYYWSKDKILGQNFPSTVMSRNRFEILLQYLHFNDNQSANKADRIAKIRPIIDMVNETFQKYYSPKENVCVDESQVPFRGRIVFRQYNKSKRHKYGLKLFKLCTIPGYTCKLGLYSGKNIDTVNTTPTKVVMSLCSHILNKGHTLATDNWYTSLELAYNLLENHTHLVGTIRKNRRGLPKSVVEAKLQRGEFMAMENEDGITVMKWKDKRDVMMLSTKHSDKLCTTVKKGKEITKPKMILDYNKSKGSVDMSDQMGSYSSPLRKTVKWYRKLGIELLLNTAIVNTWVMFTETCNSKISIVEFRKSLVEYLTSSFAPQENEHRELDSRPKRLKHELKTKSGKVRNTRRFCIQCYKDMVQQFGRKVAKNKAKKVNTYCTQCEAEPHMCLPCYNKLHRY